VAPKGPALAAPELSPIGWAARTVGPGSLRLLARSREELEAPTLTPAESQFALASLVAMCDGNRDAIGVLRQLLRKVRPTLMPRVSGARSRFAAVGTWPTIGALATLDRAEHPTRETCPGSVAAFVPATALHTW